MKQRLCVISGTGMESLAEEFSFQELFSIRSDTPWGQVPLIHLSSGDFALFLIDRHHSKFEDKRNPPHNINHRANIYAAASLNPSLIISVNSVGSMLVEFPPGSVGIVGDVLDLFSPPITFHEEDAVHVDRTRCFSEVYIQKIVASKQNLGHITSGIIVAQTSGPQFESPSEILALKAMGAHAVGMTLGPESRLIREKNIPHVALCCSSNWAAGLTPGDPSTPIKHDQVSNQADAIKSKVASCIASLIR